jgi:hypothetical protein
MNEFLLTTNKDYNIHSSRKYAGTPDANKASFNKQHQSPKIYRDTKSQPAETKHSSATIPHHKEPLVDIQISSNYIIQQYTNKTTTLYKR